MGKTFTGSFDARGERIAIVASRFNDFVVGELLDGARDCLRRHGVSRLRDLKPKATKPAHKPFKAHEPGELHHGVKYVRQMGKERGRL